MRTLITGGAGFVGSHLAEALLDQGHQVEVIDDLSTGAVDNLEPLKGRKGFRYTVDSIMDVPLMAELVDRADVVFHLAAAVGVKLIVEKPVHTVETNIRGTEIVLSLASKKNKKVVIASTSEVYGKATKMPFHEDDDMVLGPTSRARWAYACSKAIDEFLALAYYKEKKLPVVIVRLFNTVGPRQTGQYGMVIPRFVQQALSGEPITVYGDGKQSRTFTYIDDVIHALIKLTAEPKAVGQVFNIGGDAEISILDLAKRVKALTESSSEIQFIPYAEAYEKGFEDMDRRVPDISKLAALIGYRPTMGIDEILGTVIKFFQRDASSG